MRILQIIDMYFVILVIIQGIVMIAIDSNFYKKSNENKMAKASRNIGIGVSMIVVILYLIQKILF